MSVSAVRVVRGDSVHHVELEWGSERLRFVTEDDAVAFASEQGVQTITFRQVWETGAN